ncbi:MAG: NmrA family NAD(P)-binding protein [Fimbriimonadaceae bacterium]|nr:NmrA family NAD(P)-binding protein [Fimbriimonadaceae bacterium]
MAERKIIAVVGATGAQGGGLVRAIQADPSGQFQARALTRDVNSPAAQALAALGAELVAANVDDAESLRRAFEGAYGAYCVTFFWDHFSPERELAQARAMADAAKATGLQHVIWSTLEDTRDYLDLHDERMPLIGLYRVPHFDAKGEANGFFRAARVPTTFLLTSFYWDNFIGFGMAPQPGPDGVRAITLPMDEVPLPGIAAEDIGRCAYGILQRPELVGQTIGIAGEHLTGTQMAAALATTLGCEVRYNAISPDAYRGLGFPGAEDLGNMFQFKRDFSPVFCAARSVARSRELNPQLQTFAQWLAAHREPLRAASGLG